MPVSFSKSALWVSSAAEIGLLLARKVTVLPWNFFQSKSVAWVGNAVASRNAGSTSCAAKTLALIRILPGGFPHPARLLRQFIENGYNLDRIALLSSRYQIRTYVGLAGPIMSASPRIPKHVTLHLTDPKCPSLTSNLQSRESAPLQHRRACRSRRCRAR